MRLKLIKSLVGTVLILDGWKKCKLSDGSKGYQKTRKNLTLRGPLAYALNKALKGY